MRLIAYHRVSFNFQLDGFGLYVQERAVRAWARSHGHRIVDVQTDAGISGVTDAAERPGCLQRCWHFSVRRRPMD